MSNSVTLRPVAETDQPFLFQVYTNSRTPELERVPWTDEQKHSFLRFQFEAQQKHYLEEFPDAEYDVIQLDGRPVGRLYVDRRSDEIRILDIVLLTEHRGCGIGSSLLRKLIAEAKASHIPIRIHVESHGPSVQLFERLGFAKREDHGVSYLMEWHPRQ